MIEFRPYFWCYECKRRFYRPGTHWTPHPNVRVTFTGGDTLDYYSYDAGQQQKTLDIFEGFSIVSTAHPDSCLATQ